MRDKLSDHISSGINTQVLKELEKDTVDSNQVILMTGEAGTGKSTLLRQFRESTKKKIIVLAPTGVAALNVEGETIHSFFGLGRTASIDEIRRKPLNTSKRKLIRELDQIVIDEISMVRADIMDIIDLRLRQVLNPYKPFGGLQMLLIGDLYQLPPVLTTQEKSQFLSEYESPYFFSSKVFAEVEVQHIELTQIYRQTDKEFTASLGRIRKNTQTEKDIDYINSRYFGEVDVEDFDNYTIYLAPTNRIVDYVNKYKLTELSGTIKIYEGQTSGTFSDNSKPTPQKLEIAVGAQVMFLNNEKDQNTGEFIWVNGSLGKVIDIAPAENSKINKNSNLITAVDKSDLLIVELTNGKIVEVSPYTWSNEKYQFNEKTSEIEKVVQGTFTQYPVRLAWAITIHKAQGKTFKKQIVDLGNFVFDFGQTYVALSRATSLEGIILRRPIKPGDIKSDGRIDEFLSSLA